MNKVNIYCNGVSVSHKTTIAVVMELGLDLKKVERELGHRVAERVAAGKIVNPSWIQNAFEVNVGNTATKLLVTYPPSVSNIEDLVLDALSEMENEVKAVLKADRLRGLLARSD